MVINKSTHNCLDLTLDVRITRLEFDSLIFVSSKHGSQRLHPFLQEREKM